MLMQVGPIRLALLASIGGAKVKTLILPAPSQDGKELEWAEKASTQELIDGSERTRRLGYLPVLTCKWTAYDDRGPLGTGDGQRPGLEDLLVLLSQPTGMLKVSPGLAAGGFVVDSAKVKPIGKKGNSYTGLQVVFRGRDILPTMALGAF